MIIIILILAISTIYWKNKSQLTLKDVIFNHKIFYGFFAFFMLLSFIGSGEYYPTKTNNETESLTNDKTNNGIKREIEILASDVVPVVLEMGDDGKLHLIENLKATISKTNNKTFVMLNKDIAMTDSNIAQLSLTACLVAYKDDFDDCLESVDRKINPQIFQLINGSEVKDKYLLIDKKLMKIEGKKYNYYLSNFKPMGNDWNLMAAFIFWRELKN